jgi:hypothetical protein
MTLRERHRLSRFEIRMLRRISGPNRNKTVGILRKLPIEQLHNLCSSPSIIRIMRSRKMRWEEHVVLMERIGLLSEICGKARRRETTRKNWPS